MNSKFFDTVISSIMKVSPVSETIRFQEMYRLVDLLKKRLRNNYRVTIVDDNNLKFTITKEWK